MRFRRALALFAAAFAATACIGKDPTNPGAPVGTFHVKATLTSSTCGQPPNPWEFDVRINREGTTLYWLQGSLPVAGDVDRAARTKLDSSSTTRLRPADDLKKIAACEVTRTDSVDMLLATEDLKPALDPKDVHTFQGELRYEFAPVEGADCSDQLLSTNGDFESLPCIVKYTIAGELMKKPG